MVVVSGNRTDQGVIYEPYSRADLPRDDVETDQMTELAAFDLPEADVTALHPETALGELETTTHTTGTAILRRGLQAQWETVDARLAEQYRQRFSP